MAKKKARRQSPPTPAEINKKNTEFWAEKSKADRNRSEQVGLVRDAMLRLEQQKHLPIAWQKEFDTLTLEAEQSRSIHSSERGRSKGADLVSQRIKEIVVEDDSLTAKAVETIYIQKHGNHQLTLQAFSTRVSRAKNAHRMAP